MPPPASYHKPDTYLHMCLPKGRAQLGDKSSPLSDMNIR